MKPEKNKLRPMALSVLLPLAALVLLLCIFPVYRLAHIGPGVFGDYYSNEEILKALYIGSPSERRQASAVLALAEEAFNDTGHSRAENEEKYGLLSRYATPADSYADVAYNRHSLRLWASHLDGDEGWIWVYYSSKSYKADGSLVCGSGNVPALWTVEKDSRGQWTVVQIKEHP